MTLPLRLSCVALTTSLLVPGLGCTPASTSTAPPSCAEPPAPVLDPATKKDEIRHLLELTGAAQITQQILDPLFESFRKIVPGVPADVWDRLEAGIDTAELLELVVEVYDEELSHEDIHAMVTFYESPSGTRITAALPSITAKSQEAGRKYGERVAQEVLEELRSLGHAPQAMR